MNIPNLPAIIKIYFIVLSSFYTFAKVLNLQITYKKYSLCLFCSLLLTPIVFFVQTLAPLYTILSMTLLTVPLCFLIFKQTPSQTLCIAILSIGINYALYMILLMMTIPVISLLILLGCTDQQAIIIILFLLGFIQNLLLYLLFHTRRFRAGIPLIINSSDGNHSVFISALVLLLSSCFTFGDHVNNASFHMLLIAFILALGVIIWLWWQKSIQTDYINKNNSQQIDILENKLQERDAELERLSKIIHKDNKLLAALELSTRELLTDTSNEKAEALLQELNRFSKERSETLQAYESRQATLPKIGLFSIDTMLNYLHQRALKHRIAFQLSLEGDISGITDVISEQDLRTIIADLGENAIIATKESEIKTIRISIERKTDGYALCFFDSGEPFAAEVLENFGKQRCTTHAATGGSGIGLVTTGELTAKYQGEFYITDENIPQPYTKCVVVILKERR